MRTTVRVEDGVAHDIDQSLALDHAVLEASRVSCTTHRVALDGGIV